ncbi:enoyl-CoA hydratase/isomerase family protein [Rhizobium sp. ARZ01]|uniref:enoyl-CoA hydratase/isomerase family protein n=1 Tax=Rhizobium sp. ARZ01 TaxID=2769313 RepID=UPI0017842D5E|nr:enoyl-CoA hydratase/isomerase family protein [Rhizobium sp. ARZ01]MBD9375427.1 enoyl-CoA hydratase/isomerase family protein [Rhizobium sp. ARZ01]
MAYQDIEVSEDGAVGWITIRREDRLNALRMTITDVEIVSALNEFGKRRDIRAIVLTGAGERAFCTGWDMGEIEQTSLTDLEDMVRNNMALFDAVWRQRQPVIAAINGHAVATGAALAMACDLVVASENAKLAEPEIRHGALSPFLVMPFLTHAKVVHEFYYLGDPISADGMLRLGLANRVVPQAELVTTAQALGERLSLVPREALELKKRSLKAAYDGMGLRATTERHALSDTLMIGADLPWQKALQEELREGGMRAFLEARDGPFRRKR